MAVTAKTHRLRKHVHTLAAQFIDYDQTIQGSYILAWIFVDGADLYETYANEYPSQRCNTVRILYNPAIRICISFEISQFSVSVILESTFYDRVFDCNCTIPGIKGCPDQSCPRYNYCLENPCGGRTCRERDGEGYMCRGIVGFYIKSQCRSNFSILPCFFRRNHSDCCTFHCAVDCLTNHHFNSSRRMDSEKEGEYIQLYSYCVSI